MNTATAWPGDTVPRPAEPARGTVELVDVTDDAIRWRFVPGAILGHTHPLTSIPVIDALEGLDPDDHLALRVTARWEPRRGEPLMPPDLSRWPRPPKYADPLAQCAAGIAFYPKNTQPVIVGGVAIWGARRADRIFIAKCARVCIDEEARWQRPTKEPTS